MEGKLKKCPKCGKFFTCNDQGDCWCEKVQLHKKEFLVINEKYAGCLCPECLNGYADN